MLRISDKSRKLSATLFTVWTIGFTLIPSYMAVAESPAFAAGRDAGQQGLVNATRVFTDPTQLQSLGISGLGSTSPPNSITQYYKGAGKNGLDSITAINQAGTQVMQQARQGCAVGDAGCQALQVGAQKFNNQLNGTDPRAQFKAEAHALRAAQLQQDPLAVLGIGIPAANKGSVCIESTVDLPTRYEQKQCVQATIKTLHNLARLPVSTGYSYTQPYCIDPTMTLSANQSLCSKTVYSCPNGGTLNGTSCVVTKAPVSGGSNCFPEGVVFTHKYADSPLRWVLTNQSSGVVKASGGGGAFNAGNKVRKISATIDIPDLSKIDKFEVSPLGLGSYDDWLIVIVNGVGVASSVGSGYTSFGPSSNRFLPWAFFGPGLRYNISSENSGSPSINLRNLTPYLVSGENTFELVLLSGGSDGLLEINFNFVGRCPMVCESGYELQNGQCITTYPATATQSTASPGCLGAPIPDGAVSGGTMLVATMVNGEAGMTCQTTHYSCPSTMNMNGMMCEDPLKPNFQNPNCTNLGYDPNVKSEQYLCLNHQLDECADLDTSQCTETSNKCIYVDEMVGSSTYGQCIANEKNFSCPIPSQTIKSTTCGYEPMCYNGNCFTPPGTNCQGKTINQTRTETSSCAIQTPQQYRQCSLVEQTNTNGQVTGFTTGADCANINNKGTPMTCTMIPPILNNETGHYPSQINYSCVGSPVDSCGGLASKAECSLSSSQCIERQCLDPIPTAGSQEQAGADMQVVGNVVQPAGLNTCTNKGVCLMEEKFYGCQTTTSMPGDECTTDLSQVLVSMETARQAGTYMNPDDLKVFKGEFSRCDRRAFSVMGAGLGSKSCCNISAPDAKSNNDILGNSLVQSAGFSVLKQGISKASSYMYDYAMSSNLFLEAGNSAWAAGLMTDSMQAYQASVSDLAAKGIQNFSWTPSVSVSGVTASFGGVGTGIIGEGSWLGTKLGVSSSSLLNPTQLGSLGTPFGELTFSVDPVSLGIQAAWMAWQAYNAALACDQEDYTSATKTKGKLCYNTGTWCESKDCGLFGCTCTKYRTGKCCFNSKLSRIINEQGRVQLGLNMRDCGGFTTAQIQQLDWSRIDLSEFIADMLAQAQVSTNNIMNNALTPLQNQTSTITTNNAKNRAQPNLPIKH